MINDNTFFTLTGVGDATLSESRLGFNIQNSRILAARFNTSTFLNDKEDQSL